MSVEKQAASGQLDRDLSRYCFIRNRTRLRDTLVPPENLAQSILLFHQLSHQEKQVVLSNLDKLIKNPQLMNSQNVPKTIKCWLQSVPRSTQEELGQYALWLSRYCAYPEKTVAEINTVLRTQASGTEQTIQIPVSEQAQFFNPRVNSEEQSAQVNQPEITQPSSIATAETIDLSQYCFIHNQRLLTANLQPPPQQVAKALPFFHQLSTQEKQTVLPTLRWLLMRGQHLDFEGFPIATQVWLQELTELDLEDLRKARIWFSRYCFNPEKTLNEINSLVEEIGATQIVHTQESAKDTSSKSITQVQSHQSHGQVSYIELFWRCPECGTDHISAIPDLNPTGWYCPECFFRRDETVELYEAPDSRVITDPELIQQIEEGRADWKCKYCGSLNADEGYARDALACAVCGQPQMDFEESAPIRDQVGERIEFRSEDSAPVQSQTGEWIESRSDDRFSDSPSSLANGNDSPAQFSFPWRRVGAASTAVISSVGAIGVWWLSPRDLEVSVDTLPWEIQVDVEELRPVERSDWDERVPSTAKTIRTETRQRGTETVQRGTETIMVEERYQSGTTTETYTEQERYQSGTRQECTTQTTGTGAGKRTCRDVPVYSTRSVNKTRQVPVYATRQVPKEVPKMVEEPVYDTYVYYTVDEWKPIQTFTGEGYDDEPRLIPTPELHNQPYPQRVSQPRIVCHLTASYMEKQQPRVSTWKLPCDQFDLLNTGDRALLQVTRSGKVTLRKVLEE